VFILVRRAHQWADLPVTLRAHLFERLRERKISAEDLLRLKVWRESKPEAPPTIQPLRPYTSRPSSTHRGPR
jgi:hypothetical protein